MSVARSGARRWIAAGALLCAVLAAARAADAKKTSYDVGPQAVVQVIARSASVNIRVWSRDSIEVDAPDDSAFAQSRRYHATGQRFFIPPKSVEEQRFPDTPIIATLLPEDFVAPKLTPGKHDIVRIEEIPRPSDADAGVARSQVTVTIPESTGAVNVRSNTGDLTLRGYRGTTIVSVARGRVTFDGVGGDAFVQALDGAFLAVGSAFDRLRVRSNSADVVLDRCRVKEIEATTLTGDILYDDGVFDPGLARFVSDRGSIAIGVNGGAQINAHADAGQVRSKLPHPPAALSLEARPGDEPRLAGGGGPLVNASSALGDVFLYDGSLADRPPASLGPAWRPMADLLTANRDLPLVERRALPSQRVPGAFHARRAPRPVPWRRPLHRISQ